jgi:hypothetical protein
MGRFRGQTFDIVEEEIPGEDHDDAEARQGAAPPVEFDPPGRSSLRPMRPARGAFRGYRLVAIGAVVLAATLILTSRSSGPAGSGPAANLAQTGPTADTRQGSGPRVQVGTENNSRRAVDSKTRSAARRHPRRHRRKRPSGGRHKGKNGRGSNGKKRRTDKSQASRRKQDSSAAAGGTEEAAPVYEAPAEPEPVYEALPEPEPEPIYEAPVEAQPTESTSSASRPPSDEFGIEP